MTLSSIETNSTTHASRGLLEQLLAILGATGTRLDIIDAQFNLRYVDPEWSKIYGDYHGRKCHEYFMELAEPCQGCALPEVLRTRRMIVSEETLRKEDNRPIQVTSYPFQDENGEWLVAEVNVDISARKQLENLLREREQRLAVTLNSIGDAVISTDPGGNITLMNPSAEKLTGWTQAEATGKPLTTVFKIINAQTRATAESPVRLALETGQIVGLANHTVLIARNGAEHHIADSAAPIRDANGIYGVILIFRDITEEYQITEALQRANEVINSSPVMAFIWRNEKGWPVEYVSANCERILGYSAKGLLSGQIPYASLIHPDDLARVTREVSANSKDPVTTKFAHQPYRMLRPDGRIVWVDDLTTIRRNEQGAITHYQGVLLDITERQHMETALQQSEARTKTAMQQSEEWHRVLFESSADALMTIEPPNWHYKTCNQAALKLFGVKSAAEFLKMGPWDCSPEFQPNGQPSAAMAKVMIENALQNGVSFFEWTHRRMDGEDFPCTVLLSRIEVNDNITVQATVRDISKQKADQAQLLAGQRALEEMNARLQHNQAQLIQSEKLASVGQLAAGVAHEINNPIGFVGSNLHTLAQYAQTIKQALEACVAMTEKTSSDLAAPVAANLQTIAKLRKEDDLDYIIGDLERLVTESTDGVQRVREIVQSLKSFSRLDEAVVKDADINECLETTLKVVWNELKYKCEVRRAFGNLPLLHCYPGQLNQVFMNLLLNAAQAIPEKGVITIRTAANDQEITISIADTGAGIPAEHLSKLFTPFFTTKPVGKGTGLGLSVSYNIIKKHNGRLAVESKPGCGSVFTIHLPLEGVPET